MDPVRLLIVALCAFSVTLAVVSIINILLIERRMRKRREDLRQRMEEDRQRVEAFTARMRELEAQRDANRAAMLRAATAITGDNQFNTAYMRQQEAMRAAAARLEGFHVQVGDFQRQYQNAFVGNYFNQARFGIDYGYPTPPPDAREWGAAEKRAKALFLEVLSPGQRLQYDKYRYFVVLGNLGGIYKIEYGESQFLGITRDGQVSRFCMQPVERWTPLHDRMIAWKMFIETDEATFLHTANRFPTGAGAAEREEIRRHLLRIAKEVKDYESVTDKERKALLKQVKVPDATWGV